MNSLIRFSVLSAFIILLAVACTPKEKKAVGNENEIYVVADSIEYDYIESTLLDVFGKVIMTPQPESLFELKRVSFNSLEAVKNKKNVIIIAPLDSKSRTSTYINSIVNDAVRTEINKDSAFVFNKKDLWAKDQLVMILTSANMDKLRMNILRNAENLLHYFMKTSNDRIAAGMFSEPYEKKDIEAKLLFDFGWLVFGQADFTLAKVDKNNNFVWLRREVSSDKERWIFVHWIENGSPAMLHPDSIYAKRNELTKKYYTLTDNYSYVETVTDFLTTKEVNFKGRYALFTQGLWRFSKKSGGGPFLNYTFYDEKTKRIYMIDGSLFAPKYFKRNLIQQLDVLLNSFLTKAEVPKERIEDLKEYYKK